MLEMSITMYLAFIIYKIEFKYIFISFSLAISVLISPVQSVMKFSIVRNRVCLGSDCLGL